MKHLFLLLFVSLIIPTLARATSFTVDSFKNCPADEIGVGCWFGEKAKIDKGEYFFAEGTTDTCYVCINKRLVSLKLEKKAHSMKNSKGISIYRNNDYVIELHEVVVGKSDGGDDYRVTMIVRNNKGEKVVKHLIGSCGC